MHALRNLAIAVVAGLAALAGTAQAADQDMSIGSPKAPVTVIEYFSPTCPHCEHFRKDIFPAFKAKYVDTGKVRLVLRETLIHENQDAAVFLLARCVPQDKYFDVIDAMMKGQDEYYGDDVVKKQHDDPSSNAMGETFRKVFMRTAQSVGVDEKHIEGCVTDETRVKAMQARMDSEMKQYKVDGTPTFIIDGVKLKSEGVPDLAQLDAAIQPELAKKAKAAQTAKTGKRKH